MDQLVFIQSGGSHLAGKFTVAMGAFLPSVHEIEWAEKSPKFPDITKCQIQTRLSEFAVQATFGGARITLQQPFWNWSLRFRPRYLGSLPNGAKQLRCSIVGQG